MIRFAIWTAVSTTEQAAPDKASLGEQESKCRTVGQGRGWGETCPPYIAAGHSRSFYVNLSDAERDIPSLRSMLEDARADRFDVLVIYSYDRLGDLLDMVAQSLSFYGKQIYSVSQPVEPQDPEHFDRYAADAEAIMRDAARITQRFRISDLRRKRAAGMPARIRRGLSPSRVPFGYRWVGKREPPELIEQAGELVIRMKDMFLSGAPVADIIRYARTTGIRPPNGGASWQDSSIRAILVNPFYAGFVSIRRYATIRDPRAGHRPRQVKLPRSKWMIEKGLHTPLWDEATYNLLLAEMDRRRQMHIHHRVRYPLAGLLFCSCGGKLIRVCHGHGSPRARFWVCSKGRSAHLCLPYDDGSDLVARKLAEELERLRLAPKAPAGTDGYKKSIDELRDRRARIQDGYEAGGYDKIEFTRKMNEIEAKIEELQEKLAASERRAALIERFRLLFDGRLGGFPLWLRSTDPAAAGVVLRLLFDRIVVHPGPDVEFQWR